MSRLIKTPPYQDDRLEQVASESRRLWQHCFEDAPAFVSFYFDCISNPQELHQYSVDGEVVAQIHVPTYYIKATTQEGLLPVGYISGACTSSEHRGQGIMSDLLRNVLRYGYEQGHAASLLIPASEALRKYYSDLFGYNTCSYRYVTEDLMAFVSQDVLPLECSLQLHHTAQQWQNVLEEYNRFAHIFTHASAEGEQRVLYRVEANTCYIDALCANTDQDRLALLNSFLACHNFERYLLRVPKAQSPSVQQIPLGMIRPLDVLKWLELYVQDCQESTFDFHLQDEIITENTGRYLYQGDRLHFRPNERGGQSIDIQEFVRRYISEIEINLIHD